MNELDGYSFLVTMNGSSLLELLKVNIGCKKKDDGGWLEGMGIWFEISNRVVNFVGTDAAKLFWYSTPIEYDGSFNVILERTSALQLKKFVKKNSRVSIYFKKEDDFVSSIVFSVNDNLIEVSTIKGRFPNYSAVIIEDKEDVFSIIINKKALQDALQPMIDKKDSFSRVYFVINDQDISLENDTIVNKIDFQLHKKFVSTEFSLDAKILLEFLKSIKDIKEVVLYYTSQDSQVSHLKPIQFFAKDGIDRRFLIMPLR